MEIPILTDIVIILGLSVLIILAFLKFKIPGILGFLLTGMIVGPYGLNLIKASHEVELLSEIGIIFLMFVIGIEFSLKGLSKIKRTVLLGGSLQVGGTIAGVSAACWLLGMSVPTSVFIGFMLSLSSTAIVLKMLQEKGELNAPHGKVSIGLLIFQDIVVVLMILVTPLLAGQSSDPLKALLILCLKMMLITGVVILLARYLVPMLFKWVVRTRSSELFIILVVALCFATAWLTASVGLSLALGAFFAGLIISESDYSHQATANILPFREIFVSFFFVSVGMLLDLKFFIGHFAQIHVLAIAASLIKILVIAFTVILLRYPPRTVILTALGLFQVGEFSLLLSASGNAYGLLTSEVYQYFLAVTLITMGATPFVIMLSSKTADIILRAPLSKPLRNRLERMANKKNEQQKLLDALLEDHIVIIGYGINGENVAKAARYAEIPYVICDLDPLIVERAKTDNQPVYFGDATQEHILQHLRVHEARVVVVAISSPQATQNIVKTVRQYSGSVHLIVRTRYVREIDELLMHGADVVIPEEFETSIEIFTQVLNKYLLPRREIENFIYHIREKNYDLLRANAAETISRRPQSLSIENVEISSLLVSAAEGSVCGKSLAESKVRNRFGVTVLAIKRGSEFITQLTPETKILIGDVLYVFGHHKQISDFTKEIR
jgi:CPA2 family monovalent cation:H+ antiporter-2